MYFNFYSCHIWLNYTDEDLKEHQHNEGASVGRKWSPGNATFSVPKMLANYRKLKKRLHIFHLKYQRSPLCPYSTFSVWPPFFLSVTLFFPLTAQANYISGKKNSCSKCKNHFKFLTSWGFWIFNENTAWSIYESGIFWWMAFGCISLKLHYAAPGWINIT